jgi:D-alanyl-lipoteichoic acid acyltransferase DltB (MBOAT superfamily)
MALGFFKKMFLADNIAPLVNSVFSNPTGLDSLTIILGTIGFGIQIYCDFSGYTDIAIGAAMILGFKLPMNFNKPYFATSPSDFWKRWHISLSSWLRDYLYVPLGGNRKSPLRTYVNLIIVMFLGGLWHGASWNFVLWGLLHGLYLAIHRIFQDKISQTKISRFFLTSHGKIIGILIMQYFVFLAWIPFRVRDFDFMIYSMQKYLLFDFNITNTLDFVSTQKLPLFLMIIFFILHLYSYRKKNLRELISNLKLRYWTIFLILIISSILFFYDGIPENFIYFQF